MYNFLKMMMFKRYYDGIIEVITGPMFSGKSEELIKRIKQGSYAKIKTLVVKPSADDRWDQEKIISRSGSEVKTARVKTAKDILKLWNEEYKIVAIDEAQFLEKDLINVVSYLANKGVRVIVSALDQDADGKPFGQIPELLAIAEIVSKQTAICMRCGREATMTFYKGIKSKKIIVGDSEYEARCRNCHYRGFLEKTAEIKINGIDKKANKN